MSAGEQLLDDLADAVLDGEAIDWAAAESSADAAARPLVRHLRLVWSIGQVHRDVLPTETITPPAPLLEAATRESWGHLRILERVGRGAFGEVFRAWDQRLDREVALKLLPAAPASGRNTASAIIHEGRLLAKVHHPNVVTIHGAEQIGDEIGLWMEFVRGKTLEQILQQGTDLAEADVIRTGLELTRAVSAVHAAGLLHRDIKAHNVTRADDGRVVLMDFGTGRELDDSSSSDLAGTPLYLAPEVLAGRQATVQSDIYSVGVLLFHLTTRSYPVRGRTIRDIRRGHERHERVGLRTLRPNVSRALARVIERATDPQPERRYANVDALARDLATVQRRPARRRLWYGLAATAAILIVAVVAWDFRARQMGDPRSLGRRLIGMVTGAPSPATHPIIAVLPFKNFSGGSGSDLLVDSITAGFIQQLAIIDGLQVRSQTSSFMLKDELKDGPRDLAAVGNRLGVNHVIEGDAQISGNTLLIHASLVSVAEDRPIWSDKVEREITSEGDVVGVVEALTRTIVNKLRLKLGRTQRRYETADLPTYEKYLRARTLRDARGEKVRDAIVLFEEVIRKDPSYAPAQAALAAAYGYLTIWYPNASGNYISPREGAALIAPLTAKAIEIDPMLAEAHAAMGFVHAGERRWVDAEASFRRAIELEPSLTSLYGDFVLSTLLPWGRIDDSLNWLENALDADPLSLDLRRVMALVQITAARYDDAVANCKRVLDEQPTYPIVPMFLARALLFSGRKAEAIERFEQLFDSKAPGVQGWIHAINGRRAEAEAIAMRFGHLPPRQAEIYGLLGDRDRAFEALDRLADLNPMRAGVLLYQPELASLRGDPRFEAFHRKLGFPK